MNYFSYFIVFWILVAFVTFIYLLYVDAPYGRHIRKGWGKNISARLGWVVMESPCVILMIIYAWIVKDQLQVVHLVFLILWLIHYIHRSFIYPFVIDMTNPKMPISIAFSAFFFNIVNVNADKEQTDEQVINYPMSIDSILSVEDDQEVFAGQVLARIPANTS